MTRRTRKRLILKASKRLHKGKGSYSDIVTVLNRKKIVNGYGEEIIYLDKPIFRTKTSIKPCDFIVAFKKGFLYAKYKCQYIAPAIPEHTDDTQIEKVYKSSYLSTEVWKASNKEGKTICGASPEEAYKSLLGR